MNSSEVQDEKPSTSAAASVRPKDRGSKDKGGAETAPSKSSFSESSSENSSCSDSTCSGSDEDTENNAGLSVKRKKRGTTIQEGTSYHIFDSTSATTFTKPGVIRMLSKDPTADTCKTYDGSFCVFLNCACDDDGNSVIYQYQGDKNHIQRAHGLFITLKQVIRDLVGSPPHQSTIRIAGELFNIVHYNGEESSVFVMGFPNSRYCGEESLMLLKQCIEMLQFRYQTVSGAFYDSSQKTTLDSFFYDFFKHNRNNLEDVMSLPPIVPLPRKLTVQINSILNAMEAAVLDADLGVGIYGYRPGYTIIGCSVYYKDYLLTSHLSAIVTESVYLWLRQSSLLSSTQEHRLISWKEVFLPQYNKCFLLVAMQDCYILATVLESFSNSDSNGPDLLYVEKAFQTLSLIKATTIGDVYKHWVSCFSKQLAWQSLEHFGKKKREGGEASNVFLKSPGWRRERKSVAKWLNVSDDKLLLLSNDDRVCAGGEEKETADGADSDDQSDTTASQPDAEIVFTKTNLPLSQWSTEDNFTQSFANLTVANVLLQFVYLEIGDGILVLPPPPSTVLPIYKEIMDNFKQCCLTIHALLWNTLKYKECLRSTDVNTAWTCQPLVAVKEHAVLFHAAVNEDKKRVVSYWVIGRFFCGSRPREVYVCCLDSCPQSTLELAFRLGMGINL